MTSEMDETVAGVATMFDGLSSTYDQTGVPYYSVIAEGLVERLHVRPGERAIAELSRGPLALAVEPRQFDGWECC